MKFDCFLQLVGDLPWFDFATVLQLSGEPRQNLRVRLYEWRTAGKLLSLRRGMYALAAPYRRAAEPNLSLLQNALDQTQGVGTFHAADWREMLFKRVQEMDFPKLVQDVEPFLERPQDAQLLTAAHFQSLLRA